MENTFGTFIKQLRLSKNLTQKELAKLLFVSESTISKWEKDVARPDIALIPKLCEIFGCTEHELITASIDNQTRQDKVLAKRWKTLSFTWNLFFYIAYALALIPCFICNLAIDKTLSWFWIVVSALLFSFTFTNLPKLIKKHKLILLPLSMYLALCLLLGVCCIYTDGTWFFVATLSVLLGLIIIFVPIYISKHKIFSRINKYNDFISIAIDFVILNVLLIVINLYTLANTYWWYFKLALPISGGVYLILNILLSIRFLNANRFLKTSIILFLINLFYYLPPLFIKVKNPAFQKEIDSANVFKADFSCWQAEASLENNVHLILCLTLLLLSAVFFLVGFIKHKNKNNATND